MTSKVTQYIEKLRLQAWEEADDAFLSAGMSHAEKMVRSELRGAEKVISLFAEDRAKSKENPDYADFVMAACRSTLGPCEPCVIDGQCGLRPVKNRATSIIVQEDCASVWPDGTDAYFCETPDQLQALLDHVAAGTVPDVDAWHEAIR